MNRDQLIEFCAEALYDDWAIAEEQRRREEARARRWPVPRPGPPRYVGLSLRDRLVWQQRAAPMVLALERENRLKVGGQNVYSVRVDDPDLLRAYEYDGIVAWSAFAAAYEGARRVCCEDPLDFMRSWNVPATMAYPYRLPTSWMPDEVMRTAPGLVEAVAMHAFVWRVGDDQEAPLKIDPEAPWTMTRA